MVKSLLFASVLSSFVTLVVAQTAGQWGQVWLSLVHSSLLNSDSAVEMATRALPNALADGSAQLSHLLGILSVSKAAAAVRRRRRNLPSPPSPSLRVQAPPPSRQVLVVCLACLVSRVSTLPDTVRNASFSPVS